MLKLCNLWYKKTEEKQGKPYLGGEEATPLWRGTLRMQVESYKYSKKVEKEGGVDF